MIDKSVSIPRASELNVTKQSLLSVKPIVHFFLDAGFEDRQHRLSVQTAYWARKPGKQTFLPIDL
jgi:hypothetical protein